ncbi:MAG: SDR family oxidoreductase [Deltaproteobacteria bacterium]|nr:SDR family oxidoreductase [Deltaproteobacteria bacterium]
MPSPQDFTLITGASSGIGEALARRLAGERRPVALVARRTDKLERLAGELRAAHGGEVQVLTADLAKPGAGAALEAEVGRRGMVVDWLVNNAGFGTHGRFHELPVARELEEIQLNVAALVELTGRFLPAMVERRRGAVVNVASVGGFGPGPFMATYCATKAFVLSFTESLAAELRDTGVHVLCVCPGFTRTEFQEKVETFDTSAMPSFVWMTADQVAEQAIAAVGQRSVLVNGLMNAVAAGLYKHLPAAITTRLIGGMMKPKDA